MVAHVPFSRLLHMQGTVPGPLMTLPLEQLNISTNEIEELPAAMGNMSTLKVQASTSAIEPCAQQNVPMYSLTRHHAPFV